MNDPVNTTRPFVPQLNFSGSAHSNLTNTVDTRYTSFNTVYSSHHDYSGHSASRYSPTPAYVSDTHTEGGAQWRSRLHRGDGTARRDPTVGVDWRSRHQPAVSTSFTTGNEGYRTGVYPYSSAPLSPSASSSTRRDTQYSVSISPRRYQRGGDWRDDNDRYGRRVNSHIFTGGVPADRRRGDGAAGDRFPFGMVHSKERPRARQSRRRRNRRGEDAYDEPSGDSSYSDTSSTWTSSSTGSSYTEDSSSSLHRRPHARRHPRTARHGGESGSADGTDDTTAASLLDDDVDLDAQPVIPPEMRRRSQQIPFQWNRHPQHTIILSLLQSRGIYLPRYRELIAYHMAELFLHYLGICCGGSYFIYYAPGKWPKERFFRIRMMPRDRRTSSKSDLIPFLSWTMHKEGIQVVDSVPLEQLVGITATPRAASFRPFLVSPVTVIGCREGRGHRARLPVDGAFSLWFYDAQTSASRSVDLLTCDAKVYDVWTKCFRGVVSVNSSSVVQTPLTSTGMSVTMAQLMHIAQRANEELMAQVTAS